MAEPKTRGIKIVVKKRIWRDVDGVPTPVYPGTVMIMSKEEVKHYGTAVSRDLPEGEDD